MRLAYIKWRDACFDSADSGGPVHPELIELDELGWLVGETEEIVTIALELEPDQDGVASQRAGRTRLSIPKVNIVEMRVVDSLIKAFPKKSIVRR